MSIPLVSNPNIHQFEVVKIALSNFPSLAVASPGAGLYASGEAITTIAHNLGFVPAFVLYLQLAGKSYDVTNSIFSASGATAEWDIFQAYSDATNLYLLTDAMAYGKAISVGGSSYVCKYILLRERA